MKLAIMQPYFMPYLGYFALIKQADTFILFDTPQFIRHGWIERNRMLGLNGAPFYIKVPLTKHSRGTTINNVKINNHLLWKEKILSQLLHYKKKAPHYYKVLALLENVFKIDTYDITVLNQMALMNVCEYLEIDTPIKILSQMDIDLKPVKAPDEWALQISKALEATSYYNPLNGRSFFDKKKYDSEGIDLKFLDLHLSPYPQFGGEFIPGLSILDILMFNSTNEVLTSLDKFELL